MASKVTKERPHGLRYSLTLHAPNGSRIMGFDNAHNVKPSGRGKFKARKVEYDHLHRHRSDKGVPYEFVDAYQLLADFWLEVDINPKRIIFRVLEPHLAFIFKRKSNLKRTYIRTTMRVFLNSIFV